MFDRDEIKVGDRLAILLNPDGLFAGVQIAA